MDKQYELREVPQQALCFSVGSADIGDNGENAKTAPFKMLARTGDAVNHWYWDIPVYHDMAGLQIHKNRLPIDWNHESDIQLGYANRFDTSNGELNVSGVLQSVFAEDKAAEVIARAKAGHPYEASICHDNDGLAEEVAPGMVAQVNGRTVIGPALIIREWNLRSIAVCAEGADKNTKTELSADRKCSLKLYKSMDKITLSAEGEVKAAEPVVEDKVEQVEPVVESVEQPVEQAQEAVVEAPVEVEQKEQAVGEVPTAAVVEVTDDETTEVVKEEVAVEAAVIGEATDEVAVEPQKDEVEQPAEKVALSASEDFTQKQDSSLFLAKFGKEKGSIWFAEGRSLLEASDLFIAELQSENTELKNRLGQIASSGEARPVSFVAAVVDEPTDGFDHDKFEKLKAKGVNPSTAALAAALKLPSNPNERLRG